MNPHQSPPFLFSEDQLHYIQSLLPTSYSFLKISPNPRDKHHNSTKQVPEISRQKRPIKCPKDPYYEIDYDFYKNKKEGHEVTRADGTFSVQKDTISCRNLLENLKKYLFSQEMAGQDLIENQIKQVQAKLNKSSYTSSKQFIDELKQVWKKLLNAHAKDDPVHRTCLLLEQYWRSLISSLNKKKRNHSISTQKLRNEKKMTPEQKYLSTKANKRSHPNFVYESQQPVQKRKLKVKTVFQENDLQQEQRLQSTKVSNGVGSHPRKEMNPEATEASLAISPSND